MNNLNAVGQKVNDFINAHQSELLEFDLIIGISRGGLIPAALIATKLDKVLVAAYVDRQNNVYLDKPEWIKDKKVLLVDDICRTGLTLSKVKNLVETAKPKFVKTFTFFCLEKSAIRPDFTTVVKEDLKLPWD
ncbi:MAG TPA: phosphoribosyltransferase [Candidatus Paceibacterota bacterium]|nr:phosphoribosyltransferase [Candidatus Paceibacterota bacterium]